MHARVDFLFSNGHGDAGLGRLIASPVADAVVGNSVARRGLIAGLATDVEFFSNVSNDLLAPSSSTTTSGCAASAGCGPAASASTAAS